MKLNRRDFLKGFGITALALIIAPKTLLSSNDKQYVNADAIGELGSWTAKDGCTSRVHLSQITSSPPSEDPFSESVLEVRLYHYALSDEEVAQLWERDILAICIVRKT